ncbi:MAG: hypothetical protein LBG60_01275 [Bifidobacteriaceae bacterium]|jgi:hypothetical protein|nr:hypothetical protein [Bifidobacteriaceae bacterium]
MCAWSQTRPSEPPVAIATATNAGSAAVAALGLAATLVMGWQSAEYLRQEHAYRDLYSAATQQDSTVALFDMNARPHLRGWLSRKSALRSWSVVGFFGSFMAAGAAVVLAVVLKQAMWQSSPVWFPRC